MPDYVGYAAKVKASDEELLRHARERLTAAREFRRKNRESHWRENEAQYMGRHWSPRAVEDPAADLITVNVSFSTVNTILPFITGEEPRFLVEPYSVNAKVSNARLQQAWLNRYWRSAESGASPALEQATADSLIYGDGWLKSSYLFKDKQTGPDTFVEVVRIFVDRVSPWDVWLDPNATSIDDARFVVHRVYYTKAEMEADPAFEDADIDALPWGNIDRRGSAADFNYEEQALGQSEYIEVFEYWDTVKELSIMFVEGTEVPILRKVEGALPPLAQMANYYQPGSPYHLSELEQIKDLQAELNKSRSELATHRRRNISKYFIRNDVLSQEAVDALQSPIVGEAIPISTDVPLSDVVAPVQIAPLPSEAYSSADQALRDVYEITGVSEYLRGASPEIRRTATEASIIEGASNVKVQAKLRRVERASRRMGSIVLAIAKAVFPETDADEMGLFLTGDEAERALRAVQGEELTSMIEGGASDQELLDFDQPLPASPNAELRPTEDMFDGEYEVFVETASTELRNPIFKEQKFREMAQQLSGMAPGLAQMGLTLNLRKVLEKWFEAAGISDIEGMFDAATQPSPLGPQGPSGAPQLAGLPNIAAAQGPSAGITSENSGALPPTA